MKKRRSVVGIDLGTSSVKALQYWEDGTIRKGKAVYPSITPDGFWTAVRESLRPLQLEQVEAVGLSGQVGTYLVDQNAVIPWNSGEGKEELKFWKQQIDPETWRKEISMDHPELISYPVPRLDWIRKHYPKGVKICQPKDEILRRLTGNWVTDPYSWRGLSNLQTGTYSSFLLRKLEIQEEQLPKMQPHHAVAGYTMDLFPHPVPVYTGWNDFYASLYGMGIRIPGCLFDITGTSEHLGGLETKRSLPDGLISSPYLSSFVHYGVTASSGAALQFGLQFVENGNLSLEQVTAKKPPVFLPYLNGERAPVWDPMARGVFFGIEGGCGKEELAYAVMEGVVFSLRHIYETMGSPEMSCMRTVGGAAVNPVLNQMKAEGFGIPVITLEENDTSALGAAMVAAEGIGITIRNPEKQIFEPTGKYADWMKERYEIYKKLYPALRNEWKEWGKI